MNGPQVLFILVAWTTWVVYCIVWRSSHLLEDASFGQHCLQASGVERASRYDNQYFLETRTLCMHASSNKTTYVKTVSKNMWPRQK